MSLVHHTIGSFFFKRIIACIVFLMLTMVVAKAQWYTDPNAPKASRSTSSSSSSSNSTYAGPGSPGGGGTVGGGTSDPDPVPIDGGVSILMVVGVAYHLKKKGNVRG